MTRIDELLGDVFAEMATEVEPADFSARARLASKRTRGRRRVMTAACLATTAVLGVGIATLGPRSTSHELSAPPSVANVDGLPERTPKRIAMLLTFNSFRGLPPDESFFVALDADSRTFVRVPLRRRATPNVAGAYTNELSGGGTAILTRTFGGPEATVLHLSNQTRTKLESDPCPDSSSGVAFQLSPDAAQYAVTRNCDQQGEVLIYDLASKKLISTLALPTSTDEPFYVAWTPDGTRYAVINGVELDIVDAATGDVIRSFPGRASGIMWSADGRRVLTFQGPNEALRPVVIDVRDGSVRDVTPPSADMRPLGWDTPDRLVYGALHDQGSNPGVFVTADLDGRSVRDWLRVTGVRSLDQLDGIQWTTALAR